MLHGLHDPLAGDVGQLQHGRLTPTERPRRVERLGRLVPDLVRLHRDDVALRVPQRRQLPAEDGPGVEAHGVVDPLRFQRRRVPVEDHRGPAVVARPRQPHRQAVLVGLAGRVAVERHAADPPGRAPVVALGQPRVRDDELAAVEDVVRDQAVAELVRLTAELLGLGAELFQRLGEPVRDVDLPPVQRAHQLLLVVPADDQGVPRRGHSHDAPQHARGVRPAVDEVADEHRGPPFGVHAVGVAQLGQQLLELGCAAVDVADDVERPGQLALVVAQRLDGDLRLGHLGLAAQHVHAPETLALQRLQRPLQLTALPPDHVLAEVAVGPPGVARRAHAQRQVEHDRRRQHVVLLREFHQARPRRALDVRRVDDGQPPGREPLARNVVQRVEGVGGRGLVVLVVGDEPAEEVAGEHLGRREVRACERRLAGAGSADEHDEGHLGNGQLHAATSLSLVVKTAIWVGGPESWSSGPTGR